MIPSAAFQHLSAAFNEDIRAATDPSVFTSMEKAPSRLFSWLKVPTSTIKTLLRQFAKRAFTHNVKLDANVKVKDGWVAYHRFLKQPSPL